MEDLPFLAVSAPMVRYSKLPFRRLVKRHGVNLAFTPMIMADSFVASEAARNLELPLLASSSSPDDKDVVQFASNDPAIFQQASQMVAPYCRGVDLNCGCPQRWAMKEGLGSAMLYDEALVYSMVRQTALSIPVPVSVKVRLKSKDLLDTITLVKGIRDAGAAMVTVHGRRPDQRPSDPVDYEAIRVIKEQCTDVLVIANGDIFTRQDAINVYENTNVDGVMAARGLLENPALFSRFHIPRIDLAREYLSLAVPMGTTFHIAHHHVSKMLTEPGFGSLPSHLHKSFNALTSIPAILDFLDNQ